MGGGRVAPRGHVSCGCVRSPIARAGRVRLRCIAVPAWEGTCVMLCRPLARTYVLIMRYEGCGGQGGGGGGGALAGAGVGDGWWSWPFDAAQDRWDSNPLPSRFHRDALTGWRGGGRGEWWSWGDERQNLDRLVLDALTHR